jgi:uncharacterized protein (DUF2141 family)
VVKLKIDGKTTETTFRDVPPGVYGVSVIHDENSNGKLDMKWFPVPGPAEGAGVSNDAQATIGAPSYDDAKVRVGDKGADIKIRIRY